MSETGGERSGRRVRVAGVGGAFAVLLVAVFLVGSHTVVVSGISDEALALVFAVAALAILVNGRLRRRRRVRP